MSVGAINERLGKIGCTFSVLLMSIVDVVFLLIIVVDDPIKRRCRDLGSQVINRNTGGMRCH